MAITDPSLQKVVQSVEPIITTTSTFVAPTDSSTPIVRGDIGFVTNPEALLVAQEEFEASIAITSEPIDPLSPEGILEPIAPLPELPPLPPPPPTPEELLIESQLQLTPELERISLLPEILPEAPPPTPEQLQLESLDTQLDPSDLLSQAGVESLQTTIKGSLEGLSAQQSQSLEQLQGFGLADQEGLIDVVGSLAEGKRDLLLQAGLTSDQISDAVTKQSQLLRTARQLAEFQERNIERDRNVTLSQLSRLSVTDPISGEVRKAVFPGGAIDIEVVIQAGGVEGRNLLRKVGFDDREIDNSLAQNRQIQRLARQFIAWEEAEAPARAIMQKNRRLIEIDAVIEKVNADVIRIEAEAEKAAEELLTKHPDFSKPPVQVTGPIPEFRKLDEILRLQKTLVSDRKAIEEFRLTSAQFINPDTGIVETGTFFTPDIPEDLTKIQEDFSREVAGTKGAARLGIGVNIAVLPFDAAAVRKNDLVNSYIWTAQNGGMTWDGVREGIKRIPPNVTMEDWNEVKIRIAERALLVSAFIGPAGILVAGLATAVTWNDRTQGQRSLDVGLLVLSAVPSAFTIHAAAREIGTASRGFSRAGQILGRATQAELQGLAQLIRHPIQGTGDAIRLGVINPLEAVGSVPATAILTKGTRLEGLEDSVTTARVAAKERFINDTSAADMPEALWDDLVAPPRERATVILEDERGILLVRGKGEEHFITPGGGLGGDTASVAAQRELLEELSVRATELRPTGSFLGFADPSDWKGGRALQHNIFEGKISGTPRASSEIDEIAFWKPGSDLNISTDTREILEARRAGRSRVQNAPKTGNIVPDAIQRATSEATLIVMRTGKKAKVTIKKIDGTDSDFTVEIRPSPLHNVSKRGFAFSSTPDGRQAMLGEDVIVGQGIIEKPFKDRLLWFSTNPHSRFSLATATKKAADFTAEQLSKFRAAGLNKPVPSVYILSGDNLLGRLEASAKLNGRSVVASTPGSRPKFHSSQAESEAVLDEGVNLGKPVQQFFRRDNAFNKVQVFVFGEPISRAERLRLNITATYSAANTIVEPSIKFGYTGLSITKRITGLKQQIVQARQTGVNTSRLEKEVEELLEKKALITKKVKEKSRPKLIKEDSEQLEDLINQRIDASDRLFRTGNLEEAYDAAEEAALMRSAQTQLFPELVLSGTSLTSIGEADVAVAAPRRPARERDIRLVESPEAEVGQIRVEDEVRGFGMIRTGITDVPFTPPERAPALPRERPITAEERAAIREDERPRAPRRRRPGVSEGPRTGVRRGRRIPIEEPLRTPVGEPPRTPTPRDERVPIEPPPRTPVPDVPRTPIGPPPRTPVPTTIRTPIIPPPRVPPPRIPGVPTLRTPPPRPPDTPTLRPPRVPEPPPIPRIPVRPRTPSLGSVQGEVQKFRLPPEAVTWRQGFVWVTVLPPYTEDKIFFTRTRMPKTRKFRNPFQAFRRIEQIIGGTIDPEALDEWASLFQSARTISEVREIIR